MYMKGNEGDEQGKDQTQNVEQTQQQESEGREI
jgi:hypothetical protein